MGQRRNRAIQWGVLAGVLRTGQPRPIGVPCKICQRRSGRHFYLRRPAQRSCAARAASFCARYVARCLDATKLFVQRIPVFGRPFYAQLFQLVSALGRRKFADLSIAMQQAPKMTDFCDKPASIRPGEELDLAKLQPFLREHFPGELERFNVTQFPSGHSNLTYCVQLGNRQMVLRRPPFGSKVRSAHDMGREFHVLSKLHHAYQPAPKVLLYCDDASILGAPFYLMEPIRGIILRRDPPAGLPFTAETAHKLCESFIDNLARLHSIDYAGIGLADLGKPQGYLERQVRGWVERYHGSKTHDIPEIEQISSWMQENLPPSADATLIHNDYKFDNVILDADDLARIIAFSIGKCARSAILSAIWGPLSPIGGRLVIRKVYKNCAGGRPIIQAV